MKRWIIFVLKMAINIAPFVLIVIAPREWHIVIFFSCCFVWCCWSIYRIVAGLARNRKAEREWRERLEQREKEYLERQAEEKQQRRLLKYGPRDKE